MAMVSNQKWKHTKDLIKWYQYKKGTKNSEAEEEKQPTTAEKEQGVFKKEKSRVNLESPKDFDKHNFKSISSPDKHRRTEAFVSKKIDTFL